MSLNPTLATVQGLKDGILSVLQNHAMSPMDRSQCIASMLTIVNQWSTQIPLVLDNNDAPANVNLVFAIRKDLYLAPQFTTCVLEVPGTSLPPAFASFLSMILKLIGAQKPDREKLPVKVCFYFHTTSSLSNSIFSCLA
jgi:hypothetical protein